MVYRLKMGASFHGYVKYPDGIYIYTYVWPTTIGTSERVKNPSRKLETDIGHQQLDFQQQKSSLKRWDKPAITNHNAYYYLTTHQPSTPKKDRKSKRSSHVIGLRNPSKVVVWNWLLILAAPWFLCLSCIIISEAANGDIFSPWSRQSRRLLRLLRSRRTEM